MLVSVNKRFIFIANSKTGSTSIEAVLQPYAEFVGQGSPKAKHASWQTVRGDLQVLFAMPAYQPERFLRFGVMREPADWVLSWYNYRRFTKRGGIPEAMSFADFWDRDDWVKRKLQSAHFLDARGVCEFDLIIPMPELGGALPPLFAAMGVPMARDEVRNKSKGTLSRQDVEPGLWQAINAHYGADLDMYRTWVSQFPKAFPAILERFYGAASQPLPPVPKHLVETFGVAAKPARREPGAPTNHGVTIRREPEVGMRWLRIAALEQAAPETYEIRGALLPGAAVEPAGLRLILVTPEGEREIAWGLPSPGVAARFPADPLAGSCRFALPGVRLPVGESVSLWLVDREGMREKFATLTHR